MFRRPRSAVSRALRGPKVKYSGMKQILCMKVLQVWCKRTTTVFLGRSRDYESLRNSPAILHADQAEPTAAL